MRNIKISTKFFIILVLLICFSSGSIFSVDTTGSNTKTISHDCITLTLTKNWSPKEVSSAQAKEIASWLKWKKNETATIMVCYYKGVIYDYNNMRMKALNTISSSCPAKQIMLKKPTKFETQGANRATYELWKGGVDVGGTIVYMQIPIVILRIKSCWLLIFGFVSDGEGAEFEKDFIEIAKSAR